MPSSFYRQNAMGRSAKRFYHFTNNTHGLENIRRRRLKIANINELNDPFELLGVASASEEIRNRYRLLKDGLSSYMGLLCFSTKWSNPVQWSHYADRHRGVCLGFDISDAVELQEVRYTRHRLEADEDALAVEGDRATAHMMKILTTKFSHWRYEDEYRLFVKLDENGDQGLYFYNFSEDVRLREVIIGACSSVTHDEVKIALDNMRDVEIINAKLAFRSFNVIKQKSKNPRT